MLISRPYVRIAFESLEDFLTKQNRKNYFLINEDSYELRPILAAIILKDYDVADKRLKSLIEEISKKIFRIENGLKTYSIEEFEGYTSMAADSSDNEYK